MSNNSMNEETITAQNSQNHQSTLEALYSRYDDNDYEFPFDFIDGVNYEPSDERFGECILFYDEGITFVVSKKDEVIKYDILVSNAFGGVLHSYWMDDFIGFNDFFNEDILSDYEMIEKMYN